MTTDQGQALCSVFRGLPLAGENRLINLWQDCRWQTPFGVGFGYFEVLERCWSSKTLLLRSALARPVPPT